MGLRLEVSSVDPCFGNHGGSVVTTATHIGDISGCGGLDLFLKARCLSETRFGKSETQGNLPGRAFFVHAGIEVAQEKDFSVPLKQEDPAEIWKLLPELWAGFLCDSPGLRPGWVSCVGLPRFRYWVSVLNWRGLPRGSMRFPGVMRTV